MKRQRVELEDIASYENLLLATWKAARSKHDRYDVRLFCDTVDTSIAQLRASILSHQAPQSEYRSFYIHDPKKRLIHAASFPDRVLHHAILNVTERTFEKGLIEHSYACRPNKGSHCAVLQVQKNLQRYPWFIKVDVDGYFPAINHGILKALLARRFKGDGFLALLNRIVDSYAVAPDQGLPIGSLTSQHFANYYLNDADRYLQQHSDVQAVVRYMDDTIWWCNSKAEAKSTLASYAKYVKQTRQLTLKPTLQINQSKHGVTYCGYRILKGAMRLTHRKQRRYKQLFKAWESQWDKGMIDDNKLQQVLDAVLAPSQFCDALAWRKDCLALLPSRYE